MIDCQEAKDSFLVILEKCKRLPGKDIKDKVEDFEKKINSSEL